MILPENYFFEKIFGYLVIKTLELRDDLQIYVTHTSTEYWHSLAWSQSRNIAVIHLWRLQNDQHLLLWLFCPTFMDRKGIENNANQNPTIEREVKIL